MKPIIFGIQGLSKSLTLNEYVNLYSAQLEKTSRALNGKSYTDVDTTKKLVTRACCNRQYIHAYLQPFSR